jgi:hypothetical protein
MGKEERSVFVCLFMFFLFVYPKELFIVLDIKQIDSILLECLTRLRDNKNTSNLLLMNVIENIQQNTKKDL